MRRTGAFHGGIERRRIGQQIEDAPLILGRQPDDIRILNGLLGGIVRRRHDKIAEAAPLEIGRLFDDGQSLGRDTRFDPGGAVGFLRHHGTLSFHPIVRDSPGQFKEWFLLSIKAGATSSKAAALSKRPVRMDHPAMPSSGSTMTHLIFRSIMLTATLSLALVTAASAQTNNPGNTGGGNAPIAVPTGEPASNPAVTTGRLPPGATNVPADENPTVPGATGNAIVPGDSSTISGDRRATTQQKTQGQSGNGN
jgi:hypothetical protein